MRVETGREDLSPGWVISIAAHLHDVGEGRKRLLRLECVEQILTTEMGLLFRLLALPPPCDSQALPVQPGGPCGMA